MATTTYSIIPDEMTPEEYYQKARQEQIAASEASTQANLVTLNGQTETANQTYDKIAKEAYANLLNSDRQSANTLASQGLYNSGYADTNKVQLQNQYGTTISENEQNRANALRDIETQRQQYNLQGQSDIATINANFDNTYAQFMYQKQQDELAAKTAAEQQALTNAYNAAEYGDFSKLQALGVDTTTAKKLWDAKVYSQLASTYGNSSGTQSTSVSDTVTQAQAVGEAQHFARQMQINGSNAAQVLRTLNAQRDSIVSQYGQTYWDAYSNYVLSNYPGMSKYATQTTTETTADTNGQIYQEILSQGSLTAARAWLNQYASLLSNDELTYATSLISAISQDPTAYFGSSQKPTITGRAGINNLSIS